MTEDELKTRYAAALRAIGQYRLTLKWVVADLQAGVMDPTTLAAARSDLASHLGGLDYDATTEQPQIPQG